MPIQNLVANLMTIYFRRNVKIIQTSSLISTRINFYKIDKKLTCKIYKVYKH